MACPDLSQDSSPRTYREVRGVIRSRRMPSAGPRASTHAAYVRAAAALLLFSAWMGLLFAGFLFRGVLHLLLVGAMVLFPWRSLAPPADPDGSAED